MTALFDHIIAVLVGTSLLVALLFVQQRGGQTAIEATVHYTAQTQTADFVDMFERDMENMQGPERGGMTPRLWASGGQTTRVRFHTLADPSLGENSPLVAVTYELEDAWRSLTVNGTAQPLFRVARYANSATGYTYTGGTAVNVLDFDVRFFARDMTGETTTGNAPDEFGLVRVSLEVGTAAPAQQAADQAATSRSNLTRQAYTFRPLAMDITSETTPPAPGPVPNPNSPLPRNPYEPPPPPPPPPSPTPESTPAPTTPPPTTRPASPPRAPTPPPPPPPPRPTPPPGYEI
ncbi:MAG: hypothetical protein HKN04_14950 [Rhodothermaceae bacterium]|nr:hypothetical protein [Rhodothermaceae bacterium]